MTKGSLPTTDAAPEEPEIGGFFELELPSRGAFHGDMLALNSARNCLVYLLKAKGIRSLHLPHFNCAVIRDAVARFCPEVAIELYHVGADLQPILDRSAEVECLFYVSYFGLNATVKSSPGRHLIVDNAQALYAPPPAGAHAIYSPRKFVGVPDGGYLSGDVPEDRSLERDTSWSHATHLLRRADTSASAAYADFQEACRTMRTRPVLRMSRLTSRILASMDHERVKRVRRENFALLHSLLGAGNGLSSLIDEADGNPGFVPFCYPLLMRDASRIRTQLIRHKVYVPTYWPELHETPALSSDERVLVEDTLCLPIDQRYGEAEMRRIADRVQQLSR